MKLSKKIGLHCHQINAKFPFLNAIGYQMIENFSYSYEMDPFLKIY